MSEVKIFDKVFYLMMKKILPFLSLVLIFSCQTNPVISRVPAKQTAEQMEKQEFEMLMKQDSIHKHQTAAESLDVLLNENPGEKRVSLIINNNSNCNIIVRFAGEKFYNLPIYRHSKNFIVVEKGTYSLGANLCNARYSATKTFDDSATMTLAENQ